MNISEPFIRRPIATTLLMAAIAFVGIAAYPFLPVAPLPQVDFPTIQVSRPGKGRVPTPWRPRSPHRSSDNSRKFPA